ncbi:MAG: hypothetical protein ACREIF_17305 [Chthoniobacterales bacterium]
MRKSLLTFSLVALLLTALAPLGFGDPPPNETNDQSSDLERARAEREQQRNQPTTSNFVVEKGPFNLGEAIFTGTHKFRKEKVNHVAEKEHRLGILRPGLPAADQKHFDPAVLASHLNDREMNALEYYIQLKFGRFVTVAPSWAKSEPPIKVVHSK